MAKQTKQKKRARTMNDETDLPPPRGGGESNAFGGDPPQRDFDAQNFSQCDALNDLPIAVALLMPSEIRMYAGEDGNCRAFDNMLEMGFKDPGVAARCMSLCGDILRNGVFQLDHWAEQDHVPVVRDMAQQILADLIGALRGSGHVKLVRKLEDCGDAFRARWRVIGNDRGPRGSGLALLRDFGWRVWMRVQKELILLVDGYPEGPPETAPSHVHILWDFLVASMKRHFAPGQEVDGGLVAQLCTADLASSQSFDINYAAVLEPVARALWAEHVESRGIDFTGLGKVKIGAPLTQRKNRHGKPDKSFDAAAVKHSVEEAVRFHRLKFGID